MMIEDTSGLGRVQVRNLPLPDFVKDTLATYTYSGKVLLTYRAEGDPEERDYTNLAVINDDGTDFRKLFSGVIPQHQKANGLREMPFYDNRRILLGDYVLECDPDIDRCRKAALIPVEFPLNLEEDPATLRHWSEVIIAGDNAHICWTTLRGDQGAANFVGRLKRASDRYVIENPQIISSLEPFKRDPTREGYIIPQVLRGGEVKQFVRGGAAISLAGAQRAGTLDSIVQALDSEDLTQITNTPSYDETTIFSPDERLGIVMSTRGSPRTSCAVFGLMPRPLGVHSTHGLILPIYMYAVAGVRAFRKGNIGPVLIDIERSMYEPGYMGVQLHDPEERWVYYSPMSWHPGGKKALWPERPRRTEPVSEGCQSRIRIAELLDYQPAAPVAIVPTPENIPYAIPGSLEALSRRQPNPDGRIAGKHSGHIQYARGGKQPTSNLNDVTDTVYVNYSDDGRTYYRGYERIGHSAAGETIYEADLEMSGERPGEMKLRALFVQSSPWSPAKLSFAPAADGKPASHGHASYGGVTLNIADMVE